jgi:hypothetical protein
LEDFSPNDLARNSIPLFLKLISGGDKNIAHDLVHRLDVGSLRSLVSASSCEDAILVLSERLETLVLADDFLKWPELSSGILTALVWSSCYFRQHACAAPNC